MARVSLRDKDSDDDDDNNKYRNEKKDWWKKSWPIELTREHETRWSVTR